MRRQLALNALGLLFGALFVATLVAQAFAGQAQFNNDQLAHGAQPLRLVEYVTSSSFAVDVAENWQSEYLQFFLYAFATVWFVQRGSPESKEPGQEGPESDADQRVGAHVEEDSPSWARAGGMRTAIYSRSLGIVMGATFLASWAAMSVAGWAAYNGDQLAEREDTVTWAGYLATADFWNRTMQNWQSEMLAVGSFAVLAVYLRQRGSPESKPVGAAHADTGETG